MSMRYSSMGIAEQAVAKEMQFPRNGQIFFSIRSPAPFIFQSRLQYDFVCIFNAVAERSSVIHL